MFSDAYTTIENAKALEILDKLNPLLDGQKFDSIKSRILTHSLPFYNGYSLFEVSDFDNNPPRVVSFITKENADIHIMDGTNKPIYHLNKAAPIYLNEEIILTYVRFFFHYVRGRFGKFNIVENVDDINWREEPALAGKKALAKMIEPLHIKKQDDEGVYCIGASIIFKDSLFESDIFVKEDGNVNLSNQEMLVEDIPVLDDSFQQ